MACSLHLEFFQEKAVLLGLEGEAVERNAPFQVVDIVSREVGIQRAGDVGASYLFVR